MKQARERRTTCKRGHDLSGDNGYQVKHKNGSTYTQCKECKRERDRKYYALNPEPYKRNVKKWCAENKDRLVARRSEYYAKNKDRIKEATRNAKNAPGFVERNRVHQARYRDRHRDRISAKVKEKLKDPEYKARHYAHGRTPKSVERQKKYYIKQRQQLADIYLKHLLMQHGHPKGEVSPELIELKRIHVMLKRQYNEQARP